MATIEQDSLGAKPGPDNAVTGLASIQLLPSELVNQIAAGEVVERPASVVKELVENALDAGAGRLTVDLEDGGKGLIRVADDGGGIAAEDLPLAVQNHATSKLRSLDDLFAIASLGFRGEALASIASVSQFSLASRRGELDGAEIRIEGGKAEPVRAAGIPRGTRVEVRNLFFNVPARRKFLKSTRSELNAVTDQLTRLALSRPDVFVSLRHDGKQVLSVPPSDEPRERIARLATQVIAQEIVAFGPRKGKRVDMEIRGYLSPFHLTRGDTRGQYFFLNGRSIRDPLLLKMVRDAYLHLLPPRRHPYIYLWLELDPGDVDVNVHPTKAEVRFRRSSDVYALVLSTMKEALAAIAEPPALLSTAPKARAHEPGDPNGQAGAEGPSPASIQSGARDQAGTLGFQGTAALIDKVLGGEARAPGFETPRPFSPSIPAMPPGLSDPDRRRPGAEPGAVSFGAEAPPPKDWQPGAGEAAAEELRRPQQPDIAALDHNEKPYGRFFQMHKAFIVEETGAGLRIIDQHALHERILYDEIVRRLGQGELETQRLLFPVSSELDAAMQIAFHDAEPVLTELGFETSLEDGVVELRSIPRYIRQERALQIVLDLLGDQHPSFVDDEVQALDKHALSSKAFATPEGRTLLHTFAASLACKAAVKFGMPLSDSEISALLEQRHQVERAYCCPHGRPTTLSLSMGELRRRFGRPG